MLFIVAVLLGTLVQPCFFQCTNSQLGQSLPETVFDTKRCLSLSQETFENIGNTDLKMYTWTKGDETMIGYCPLKGIFTFNPTYGNTVNVRLTVTTSSGKNCNVTQTGSKHYTAEPDPGNGNYSKFTTKEGNETWQFCHTFQIFNGAFASTIWRTDPPPQPGTGFGYVYVFFIPKGDCQQDEIHEYLSSYDDVYWKEIGVDCSSSGFNE